MAGSTAMAVQVGALMWLRTTVNYQYAHGNGRGTRAALQQLYAEGGVPRLYRGFSAALVHAPLARFGDVASYAATRDLDLPHWQTTALGSAGSAAWKLALMPLDTLKTTLQVHGSAAPLARKVRAAGPGALFHGYIGTAGASMLGYYPWFFTYGALDRYLPSVPAADDDAAAAGARLVRHAALGFGSSAVSDTVSNAVRVVKVCRQTHGQPLSYAAAARTVVQTEGWWGLLGRGLRTKLLANGVQGATFSVAWRFLEQRWAAPKTQAHDEA